MTITWSGKYEHTVLPTTLAYIGVDKINVKVNKLFIPTIVQMCI